MGAEKGNYRAFNGYEGLRPLDKFGRSVMEHLRDDGIGFYEGLTRGHWKGEDLATLQSALQSITDEQKEVV